MNELEEKSGFRGQSKIQIQSNPKQIQAQGNQNNPNLGDVRSENDDEVAAQNWFSIVWGLVSSSNMKYSDMKRQKDSSLGVDLSKKLL